MKTTSLLKRVFLLAVLGSFILTVYYLSTNSAVRHVAKNILDHLKHDLLPVEDLSGPGVCRIPEQDPWDASIIHFFPSLTPLVCDHPWKYPLTFVNGSCLFVNQSARRHIFSTVNECFFKYVLRPEGRDDVYEFSQARNLTLAGRSKCVKLSRSENFVKIICYDVVKKEIYKNYHAYIHFDSPKFERKLKTSHLNFSKLSINILGLDSVSRSNVIRKLPKTYKFLTEELDAVVFQGYNKVADNTFPNIVPLLIGKSYDELTWVFGKYFSSYSYLDKYDFIWKRAEDFVTLLAEDDPEIATFNTGRKGFSSPPSDFYMRPYWLSFWRSKLFNESSNYCLGSKRRHALLLDWGKRFFELCRQKSRSYFSYIFYTELVHHHPNLLGHLDDDVLAYIKSLDLNTTAFLFFGDHGHRNGKFRQTFVGKMEDRLPWLAIVLPAWFKLRYPLLHKNLVRNSNNLVTLFDVHEALVDLLFLDNSFSPIRPRDLPSANQTPRKGVSLFQQIPRNRSCKDAGIEAHYCSCLTRTPIKTSSESILIASSAVVTYINNLTNPLRHLCAKLKLKKVIDASLLQPNSKVLSFKGASWFGVPHYGETLAHSPFKDYTITVQTIPGDAIFEATVRIVDGKKKYEVSPDLSRVNLYGDQADCVKDKPDLKKYCFCQK